MTAAKAAVVPQFTSGSLLPVGAGPRKAANGSHGINAFTARAAWRWKDQHSFGAVCGRLLTHSRVVDLVVLPSCSAELLQQLWVGSAERPILAGHFPVQVPGAGWVGAEAAQGEDWGGKKRI